MSSWRTKLPPPPSEVVPSWHGTRHKKYYACTQVQSFSPVPFTHNPKDQGPGQTRQNGCVNVSDLLEMRLVTGQLERRWLRHVPDTLFKQLLRFCLKSSLLEYQQTNALASILHNEAHRRFQP
mmetsp:Transcript_9368/g.25877  ORF Transcript_9368/g.25877 Transcript_9368/m.25877 type:complete len:123 (+) Transcript_9368:235-603(+)